MIATGQADDLLIAQISDTHAIDPALGSDSIVDNNERMRAAVASLAAEVRYEPGSHGEDELFPHLYGPLNLEAVRAVHDFPCEPDGSFILPSAITEEG